MGIWKFAERKPSEHNSQSDIVFLASIDAGSMNAPAIHVLNLAHEIARSGLNVVLIIPRPQREPVVNLNCQRLKVQVTPRISFGPTSLDSILQLRALWKFKMDRIYIRSAPLSLITSFIARIVGYKFIYNEYNGWFADEVESLNYPKFLTWLIEKMQIQEAKLADGIRVVTPGLKSLLVQYGVSENRITVTGNGTNLNTYRPLDKLICRNELGLSLDEHYIIFSGNLTPWVDLICVFEAIHIVREWGYKVVLLIAGEGVYEHRFRIAAQKICDVNAVRFLGPVSPFRVNQLLNASDIAIVPLTHKRNDKIGVSPLKLRDYAAAGKLIIASDLPGIRELSNQEWIRLYECSANSILAEKIKYFLNLSNNEKDQLENSARKYAETHFSWSHIASKIMIQINY